MTTTTPDEIISKIVFFEEQIKYRFMPLIAESTDFEKRELLKGDLARTEFVLEQLRNQLALAEQAQAEEARQKTIKAYNAKLDEYAEGIAQLDQISSEFTAALQVLEDAYTRHYELGSMLHRDYEKLTGEAESLGQPKPEPYPSGSYQVDSEIKELCKYSNGTITRKLTAYLDPLVASGWAKAGVW